MHPIAFQIGDFPIHSYGLLGAVAFLLVAGIGLVRGRNLGLDLNRIADLIFLTAIASLLGSRALFLVQNPEVITHWSDWVNLRSGGLVFYGALLTGLPVATLLMRAFKMPVLATWDIFATAMPLGHALTRLGCLCAGCCFGLPSDAAWAIRFEHPLAVAPSGVALHPVQLYESAWLLIVALAVNLLYRRRQFSGQVTALYLFLYAIGRSVIELFRGDADRGWFLEGVLGPTLTYSQGVSLALACAALLLFWWGRTRGPDTPSS